MKLSKKDVLILGAAGVASVLILQKAGLLKRGPSIVTRTVGDVPKDYGIVPAGVSLADYWLGQAQIYGTDS